MVLFCHPTLDLGLIRAHASVFLDARPRIAGYMGNFYEDYYGDGEDDE